MPVTLQDSPADSVVANRKPAEGGDAGVEYGAPRRRAVPGGGPGAFRHHLDRGPDQEGAGGVQTKPAVDRRAAEPRHAAAASGADLRDGHGEERRGDRGRGVAGDGGLVLPGQLPQVGPEDRRHRDQHVSIAAFRLASADPGVANRKADIETLKHKRRLEATTLGLLRQLRFLRDMHPVSALGDAVHLAAAPSSVGVRSEAGSDGIMTSRPSQLKQQARAASQFLLEACGEGRTTKLGKYSIFDKLASTSTAASTTAAGATVVADSFFNEIAACFRQEEAPVLRAMFDRAVGAMLGMAVGDSFGAPLEFMPACGDSSQDVACWKLPIDCENHKQHYDDPEPTEIPGYDENFNIRGAVLNKFRLKEGQFTDDTSMGLCIADSLLRSAAGGAGEEFDGADMRCRFWHWWNSGYNNSFRLDAARTNKRSVGLGGNIAGSLYAITPPPLSRKAREAGEAPLRIPIPARFEAGTADAGNGCLMRLAPVPVRFCFDADVAAKYSVAQCATTHPGALAGVCSHFFGWLLAKAIQHAAVVLVPAAAAANDGLRPSMRDFLDQHVDLYQKQYADTIWAELPAEDATRALTLIDGCSSERPEETNWNWRINPVNDPKIEEVVESRGYTYNGYPFASEYFGSFCCDGLALALHSLYTTTGFAEAVRKTVNHMGDADTTGAICGQLAGAFYGYTSIEQKLVNAVERWDGGGEIRLRAALLFAVQVLDHQEERTCSAAEEGAVEDGAGIKVLGIIGKENRGGGESGRSDTGCTTF